MRALSLSREDAKLQPLRMLRRGSPSVLLRLKFWSGAVIRLCLAGATFSFVTVAAASLQPALSGEAISVGSHIPGAPSSARPVHVFTREDIETSGLHHLYDLLVRRAAYNSFGLYRTQLLGLAGTAVMIDGRPVPNPNTNYILEFVPLAAVERIEVMSDGAAALHPGGAVGAINIVLRRGFEGTEAWADAERPGQRGGDTEHAGALWGGKVGRGHLTMGIDGLHRGEIRMADRAFSRASWTEGGSFAGTAGLNAGGNTLFIEDDRGTTDQRDDKVHARSLGACSGRGYTGPLTDPLGIPGTGCGFAYADIAWQTVRFGRYSLFANYDRPLDKATTLYANARFAQGKTKLRYAPSVGQFAFRPSQALLDQLSVDSEIVSVPEHLHIVHRFVAHGNREWSWDLLEHDVTLGLRGRLRAGIGYDLSVRDHRYTGRETGVNLVSEDTIREEIQEGHYFLEDPLNPPAGAATNHRNAIRASKLRLDRRRVHQRRAVRVSLNGPAFALPGGPVRWAAGLEVDRREERDTRSYRHVSGAAHDSTHVHGTQDVHDVHDVLGSGGIHYSGKRVRWSGFGEVRLPLHREWDISLAARHDKYGDVGATWSYQAATVWRLHKNLSVRGSWETGRSPAALSTLHAPSFSYFPRICDTRTYTGPRQNCPRHQIEAIGGGNPELEPDRTQIYGIGAKARLGFLSLGADWFKIEVSDTPAQLSTQTIIDQEAAGRSLPPGAAVNRDGNGVIDSVANPIVNSGKIQVSGLDLRGGAKWKTGTFDTGLDIRWLHLLESETRIGGIDQSGDFPRNRVHAALSAGRGGWTFEWNIRAISGFSTADGSGRFPAWIGHDLLFNWHGVLGQKGLMLRGGAINLTDRGPSTDSSDPGNTISRYDAVRGRTFFLSLEARW